MLLCLIFVIAKKTTDQEEDAIKDKAFIWGFRDCNLGDTEWTEIRSIIQ